VPGSHNGGGKNAQLRNLIAGYGDPIRLSDIKANIAVLFVAIMMETVLQFREHSPWYLLAPVLLAPFMFIFLNLLVSVYPRYPRSGRTAFQSGATRSPRTSKSSPTSSAIWKRSPSDARCFLAFSGGKQSRFRPPMSPRCSRSSPAILLIATHIRGSLRGPEERRPKGINVAPPTRPDRAASRLRPQCRRAFR
jgi:hypothetical protein